MNKLSTAWSVKRINKYRNQPCIIDGHRFASKREGKRYSELKLLERGNYITDLKLQPRYKLTIGDSTICTYIADFSYIERGKLVVEDVKSVATKTPVYRLKNKMMKALYAIDIKEII